MDNNSNVKFTTSFVIVSPDDLRTILSEVVREEVEKLTSSKPTGTYTRKDVARLYSISLPTLNRWQKEGYLVGFHSGGKVLYHKSDIINVLGEPNDEK